ncbi:MAG: serine acetyltransferase, partial [Phycisphaerae bacterium]
MTFRQVCYLIRSDLHRYHGRTNWRLLARELLFGVGFKYSFWMRVTAWLSHQSAAWFPIYLIARLFHRRYIYKFGISIPFPTVVGPGFYIGHFGGIHVNSGVRIGRNCNISQDVTIGQASRGERRGVPNIGDNVYIGPGAKIFGGIRIGDHVAIGANCVVTRDVPDHAVVVGVPGRVVNFNGSEGYINRTDYDYPLPTGAEAKDHEPAVDPPNSAKPADAQLHAHNGKAGE